MKFIIFLLMVLNARIVFRCVIITAFSRHGRYLSSIKTIIASIFLCSSVTIVFCLYELYCDTPTNKFQFISLIFLYSVIFCEALYIIDTSEIYNRIKTGK